MSELTQEYGDQVNLTVISAEQTAESMDELEKYNLSPRGHGLVAFTTGGEAVFTIAGHNFGREEITMAIQQVTAP